MEIRLPLLDLEKIALSGQCFRWERLGRDHFRIPHAGECLEISMTEAERFSLSCGEEQFETLWRDYFDLDTDYAEIIARIDPRADPFLYAAALDQRGVRILRQDGWEMLVTSVITQNRNIPAIQKSVAALCRLAGQRKTDGAGREFYTFPAPEEILAMDDKSFSLCRLGYRDRYVKAAAEAVRSGAPDLDRLRTADDAECREALLRLTGVGEKVAACVMLFGLHRLNAFPRDVWMNRMLMEYYPGGFPFERFAPWNGVYQQYLFAYYRKLHGA